MSLMPGTRVGPYEVTMFVGAGGMGEVYKARDTRLERTVALKILPESFAADPPRLQRFEQEARILATLSHANIVAVYDVGSYAGKPYLVSEFLEGKTLRERLDDGPLPVRKAIEYATEIAQGLAAAHEKGIVHRDLKPENVFVTADGHIKLLDFGLARSVPLKARASATEITQTTVADTEPGTVMGTAGYMSPEQVKGIPVDFRCDIFSFGSVLYEMVYGLRAFQRNSSVETMNAIINEEPADVQETRPGVPPEVDRILRHCLEKEPQHRFQSARDVAFDLAAISTVSDSSGRRAAAKAGRNRQKLATVVMVVALLAAVAGGLVYWTPRPLEFEQMTFRRGYVYSARFVPTGNGVLYSAAWSGDPSEIFSASMEGKESRPLGMRNADLLAISSRGELAVLLSPRVNMNGFLHTGTLATVNISGGTAPRELAENVEGADWSADGNSLAVLRSDGPAHWLEYPVGKEIYRPATPAWLSDVRVSRSGDLVAVLEHGEAGDDRGWVTVLDSTGAVKFKSGLWSGIYGLAWKSANELLISAIPEKHKVGRQLFSLKLNGRSRPLQDVPGEVTLQDISKDGSALITLNERNIIIRERTGQEATRDLSWLDRSILDVITPDGSTILFHEGGQGGGPMGTTFLRSMDGSPAVKLCEGYGIDLSPDKKWVMVFLPTSPVRYQLVPTKAGQARPVATPSIEKPHPIGFSKDGKGLIWIGMTADNKRQVYFTEFDGSKPRPTSPPGTVPLVVSANGRFEVRATDQGLVLWRYDTGSGYPLNAVLITDSLLSLSDDGESLYVARARRLPTVSVQRVNTRTGAAETVVELTAEDMSGVVALNRIVSTPDGKTVVYSYTRHLSQLYLTSPLK